VAHQGVVNGKLAQRVIDGQDGPAGIAEDVGDALAYQRGPNNLSAGEAGGLGQMGVRCLRVCVGSHEKLLFQLLAASL